MNKEQQDIILDVYREHCLEQSKYLTHGGTIQEFIKKIKTDDKFSERWGLKIEERELSFEERCEIQIARLEGMYSSGKEVFIQHSVNDVKQITMDKNNIPTKLITITYNDTKLESYE
jgi:hypothetical protein